ncbi:nineteen complex-related protein 2-domain-containing protein [Polychytrium aggregatum]|uniref:nineteen complex-related protein 2-domain-containing protein n=1 Tax=Polychytrium aggregatum TaxID=110093 RepID=UPI0022FF056A|nr:nineteen complex-related protein 2-domain-containing protein [Polychytrium aggregatum]KAI9209001.1 nineteen complex-related protein 2-domain-containing protein [Polychytrium aggregatum]
MSAFRKPKARAIRKKTDDPDDPLEGEQEQPSVVRPSKSSSADQKQPKKASKLSFDDDIGQDEESNLSAFKSQKISSKGSKPRKFPVSKVYLDEESSASSEPAPSRSYSAHDIAELKLAQSRRPLDLPEDSMDIVIPGEAGLDESALADSIPDEDAIKAAKLERQKRRHGRGDPEAEPSAEAGGSQREDDYVSLKVATRPKPDVGSAKQESRLVTEEQCESDNEAFEDHQGAQIMFGNTAAKTLQDRKRREMSESTLTTDQIEDEEAMDWEREQLKKSGIDLPDVSTAKAWPSHTAQKQQMPSVLPIPSVDDVIQRLSATLTAMKDGHSQNQAWLGNSKTEMDKSVTESHRIEDEIKGASAQYNYFQEFSIYSQDMADLIDAKLPELEALENRAVEAMGDSKQDRIDERAGLLKDDLAAFTIQPVETGVDELGRDIMQKNATLQNARRVARAEKRKRHCASRKASGLPDDHEGLSSDDESTDIERPKLDIIQSSAKDLLADARDSLGSIPKVLQKFAKWRELHSKAYEQSYGGLCLPGVLELLIRCEMVGWNPLQQPARSFEQMPWFQAVTEYVRPADGSTQESDAEIVSKLVGKVVVPRLLSRVKLYNPFSTTETRMLIEVFESVARHIPRDSAAFKGLVGKLVEHVDDTILVLLQQSPDNFRKVLPLPVDQAPYRNRWFWTVFKLLPNLLAWKDLVHTPTAQRWCFESILDQMLLSVLDSPEPLLDDLDKYARICRAIPQEWKSDGGYVVPKHLRNLERSMVAFVKWWQDRSLGTRTLFQEMSALLVDIQSLNEAARVSKIGKLELK